MELRIPAGALTKDEVLRVGVEAKEDGISNLYVLHDEFLPLVKRATLMLAPRTPVSRPEKCYIESSRGYVGGDYADGWFSALDSGFGRVVCVGYGHRGACGSLEDGFQWQESQCVALRTDGQRFGGEVFLKHTWTAGLCSLLLIGEYGLAG